MADIETSLDTDININHNIKIAVIIPAHNEAETISACLTSVKAAIKQLPHFIEAYPLVVLDSCTDSTLERVKDANVNFISCDYHCVGQVRDMGIRHAINEGATWLACTDADTIVSANWLVQQVNHITQTPTDMICGIVSIEDWAHLTPQTREEYMAHYQDTMGHPHIHGANLSFSRDAYLATKGFGQLACHEDVNLVNKFKAQGYHIVYSNKVRVTTSSRLQARASEGFAAFLNHLESQNLK